MKCDPTTNSACLLQLAFLGRAFKRGASLSNISPTERTGGGVVGVFEVGATGVSVGCADVSFGVGTSALPICMSIGLRLFPLDARAAGTAEPAEGGNEGPSRRERASSIERPMFWMIERTCWALRVGRFGFITDAPKFDRYELDRYKQEAQTTGTDGEVRRGTPSCRIRIGREACEVWQR
jgi:hypothetical protein